MPKPPLPEDAVRFLQQPNPAVMGTVRADGAPVTVATWYLWEEGGILVNLDESRRRLEHLRRDPRVSLTVLDEKSWYRHISVQGAVTLADDPDLADIDRLARHYTGKPYPVRDRGRVSARITVESYHIWGHIRGHA